MQTSVRDNGFERIWFLGTGPLEYYYTLWSRTTDTVLKRSYYSYRQNLSHDYAEAVAKATEMTGQTNWQEFDISEYKRTNSGSPDLSLNPDEVTMTFGKFAGMTVGALMDHNMGYLWFLAAKSDWQPTQSRHAKVLNYIRAMFRQEAVEAEETKQARIAAERAARDAARKDLPAFEGRVTILGTVISVKFVENNFGGTLRMLVEHVDGWKVWGTVPSAILSGRDSLERGDVVRFDAIVQKSDKDPKFGFFSRPTKATLVKSADIPEPAPAYAGAPATEDYGHFGGNYDAN